MKLKRLDVPLEVKAVEDGFIEGYGSVFNNTDAYGDVVVKGAFVRSLGEHAEKKTAPAMLWQHNPDWPVGKWVEVREDDRGLYMKGQFADTAQAKDVRTLARMGAITGMSIGFVPKKADYDKESDLRMIRDVDLWEVSLVTFPANDQARVVEARAADLEQADVTEIERTLRDAGLSRREAKTVVSRLMFLGAQRDAEDAREAAQLMAKLENLRKALRC